MNCITQATVTVSVCQLGSIRRTNEPSYLGPSCPLLWWAKRGNGSSIIGQSNLNWHPFPHLPMRDHSCHSAPDRQSGIVFRQIWLQGPLSLDAIESMQWRKMHPKENLLRKETLKSVCVYRTKGCEKASVKLHRFMPKNNAKVSI